MVGRISGTEDRGRSGYHVLSNQNILRRTVLPEKFLYAFTITSFLSDSWVS